MNRSQLAVLAAALVATACETPTIPNPESSTTGIVPLARPGAELGLTPFQERIRQMMTGRSARRRATPAVRFEFNSPQGSSLAQLRTRRVMPGGGFSYTARTVLDYRGPADAELARWPEMTLTPQQEARLGVTSAELKARYIARREALSPGFWQRYEYGLEPRTYAVSETESRSYPVRNAVAAPAALRAAGPITASVLDASSGSLVFGFSVILPSLEKHVTVEIPEVESLHLDFEATAGAGLRIPMSGAMSGDEPVNEGDTFSANSTVSGQDWSGAQYADVSLPAEDGHEAYYQFTIQGCVDLNGIIDPDKQCAGPNVVDATDFTTPLGAGNLLALPTINVPIVDYDVAGLDFIVKSEVGSDQVTADWTASAEGLGSGTLSYTNSGTAVSLADILAVDGPGTAQLTVDNFKYYFNQFAITPGVKLWVDIEIPIPLAPNIDWEDSWTFTILTINLFDLLPLPDLGIPIHGSPYNGGSSLSLGIDILNVPPSAAMTLAGGTIEIINGVETVVGTTGANFTFTGTSYDPGRDGLTLSWNWGDGAPDIDVSTTYPILTPTGPMNAADVQVHAFTRSCMYEVVFKSVDDDAAFDTDAASILVTQSGQPGRLEGYWQKQFGRSGGSLVDPAVLVCYLRIVDRVSLIFNEVRSAATLAEAFAVLNLPQNGGSAQQQIDREILVAWLNFAAGAVQYHQLVDSNGDGTPDTAFDALIESAEAVRLNPASTAAQLKAKTVQIHKVNEQFVR
jgi:hypothetical protein